MALDLGAEVATLQRVLQHRGDTARRQEMVSHEAKLFLSLGDAAGHEVLVSLASYVLARNKVSEHWRHLTVLTEPGPDTSLQTYYSREEQYRRLGLMQQLRFRWDEPQTWANLLLHVLVSPPRLLETLDRSVPLVNALAFCLGFVPDLSIAALIAPRLGWDLLEERYMPAKRTARTHFHSSDTISAFIHFYLSKVGREHARVSKARKLQLLHDEEVGLAGLRLFHYGGEIYRGWLMVGMTFLAPYALAPELVAAGGFAAGSAAEVSAQAAAAAEFAASQLGTRAMLLFIDMGPAFLELALAIERVVGKRGPITPGDVLAVLMSAFGCVPSARLGYFMTGATILSPAQPFQDFLGYLEQCVGGVMARVTAAKSGLELATFDSAPEHTLIIDLED